MLSLKRMSSIGALCLLLAALSAAPAGAAEPLNHPFLPGLSEEIHPQSGGFLDACGAAVNPTNGNLYVSDYYRHAIDVFSSEGHYLTQIAKEDAIDGPCGLAFDTSGDLYVNNYHRDVVEFTPAEIPNGAGKVIDSAHPTGVAVDPATGNLYVDDRTYVAVYEAPVGPGEEPVAKIGLGSLEEGYGVAVSGFAATKGDVYVADAATGTVRVYGPSGEQLAPIDGAGTPQGGFNSLADASLAVDQSNGHLFVVDDTQPGFEHPAAVVDEFNATGDYRGRLPHAILDAEPTGLAVSGGGDVFATSGNWEEAGVDVFGPGAPGHVLEVRETGAGAGTVKSAPAGIECGTACTAEYEVGETVTLTAAPAAGSAFSGWTGGGCSGSGTCTVTMSADKAVEAEFEAAPPAPLLLPAEVPGGGESPGATALATQGAPAPGGDTATLSRANIVQKGALRINFDGSLTPHALPRTGSAPVRVAVGANITTTDGSNPPQLRQITIAINREGHFNPQGLPLCRLSQIQPSSTASALRACRASLVGQGSFSAKVLLPEEAPFPSNGKVYAFNGTYNGRPAILAHVYGTNPVPTSYTIPFVVSPSKGTFGTTLNASLPQVTSEWGYVTGLQMTLGRTFSSHGKRRSYLSAACPAPKGLSVVPFPLARASFAFPGKTLTSILTRTCRARG